jgi:hypothetical protein
VWATGKQRHKNEKVGESSLSRPRPIQGCGANNNNNNDDNNNNNNNNLSEHLTNIESKLIIPPNSKPSYIHAHIL